MVRNPSHLTVNYAHTVEQVFESNFLWDRRLIHAPLDVNKKLKILGHLKSADRLCRVCPLAKHTKLPFPVSNSSYKSPFELLHYDIYGPY